MTNNDKLKTSYQLAAKSQPGLDFVLLKDKLCIFVYDGSVPPLTLTDVSESEYQNTRSI